ncbi:MAG TPA: AMP-binding protein, partial [Xanthobacteraceae bacterium]|nr:AMP-binding protein [Xanthobacteraceae bacterium]
MAQYTASNADTFPKFLLVNAELRGSRPAIREKDFGIWQTWTWAQVKEEVKALALGLKELGVERGDKVAIVGSNKPRLYWSMCAAQSIGAIPVPVYQDAVAEEMTYVLQHAGAKVAVVENQEQVDKVLSISDRLPSISHVIYDEPRGLRDYDHTRLKWINEVQEIGRKATATKYSGDAWEKMIAEGKGSDIAVILYTSGTTGNPKGVMLTYDSVVVSSRNANTFDNLTEKEEVIAYLPMAWVGDHIFSYAQSYVAGYTVNCPESPETIIEDRREIGTSYAFAPPRVYENL